MAASPTFVNAAIANSFGNSQQIAPLPVSRTNGNLLVAFWYFSRDSGATFSFAVQNGFTFGDQVNAPGTNFGAGCWAWRYVDGTEGDVTIQASAATTYRSEGVVLQYSGVDPTASIGAASKVNGGADGTMVVPGIVTTNVNSVVIAALMARGGATIGTPTGYTSQQSQFFDNPDHNMCDNVYSGRNQATGNISASIGADESYAGFLLEVRSKIVPPDHSTPTVLIGGFFDSVVNEVEAVGY